MELNDFSAAEIDLLKGVRLFQGLEAEGFSAILKASRRRAVPRDAYFFHEGDPASGLYILTEGRVKLTQTTPEGHRVVLRIAGPGQMFGDIAAFGETAYPASALAVTDARSLTWDGKTMARMMDCYPRIALNALRHLAARLQEAQDRYRELATERVEQRVARALLRLARQAGRKTKEGVRIDMPLSHQDLAEMTGTTLYTVSRILSAWRQKGLVQPGRARVTILSPHGLVSIAEDLASNVAGDASSDPSPEK